MPSLTWLGGLLRRRPGRVAGAGAGVALAVALLGSLGAFLANAKATMTQRAVTNVVVDWQVEAEPGADPVQVLDVSRRFPDVRAALPVGFATTTGLRATAGGTSQTTGPGRVLGFPPGYETTFPGALRTLAGRQGVLLAQQTAANLHAGPGDTIAIGRAGLPDAELAVDGVVDLPQADSLFQQVGAPPGAQPQAPPDNVVVLPADRWEEVFAPLAATRPDLVRHQAHARLTRRLPTDPAAAFSSVSAAAHNLEARLSGAGRVGDNLAAALDAARKDALYSQVLFVLLGLPGAVLAGLLTRAVAGAGRLRRRRDLGLLRARGASTAALGRLAAGEAAAVALAGSAAGLAAAAAVGALAFGSATFGSTRLSALFWAAGAVLAGSLIALLTVLVPARRDARTITVAAARATVGRTAPPPALRWWADAWLLGAAALVFWATSRSGYALVLAPEGVPSVSVSYWALAGPVLFWLGAGVAGWRATEALLGRGSPLVRRALRPLAGTLARPVASTLRRQRRTLANAVVIVALTVAFALSTSIFNATYHRQVGVDALLTNGADVTVTAPGNAALAPDASNRVRAVPGVGRAELLQHRFAYVGTDLQDLYGVDPHTVVDATRLQDAYFAGGSARALMGELARHPDAALVSAETAKDFQLQPGDRVRLRLRDAATGQLRPVDFRFSGVVKEFPTAPRDSFLVANAAYVSAQTGDPSNQVLLVDAAGVSPTALARRVRAVVGPGPTVSDIDASRRVVGSALTAVDLAGLTRVELGFALVLGAGATGLVLVLELAERRRAFAVAVALGARPRQIGAFIRSEALVVISAGMATGVLAGWLLAQMLVKVLTGVFDPPPTGLAVPWAYLVAFAALAAAATAAAAEGTLWATRRPAIETIRDL